MKVVAICSTEPALDGIRWSDTFINNINTWRKYNPDPALTILDARKYMKEPDPIKAIWAAVAAIPKIDLLIYSGHSSPLNLLVFYHAAIRLTNDRRYLGSAHSFSADFSKDARIILWGCQTAGVKGVQSENSIAQTIANKTKRKVLGFTWRSSQKLNPAGYPPGYYQLPEHGGLVEVTPK